MNLVYGSLCPLHSDSKRCPCRTLTTNASIWTAAELGDAERVRIVVTEKGRSPNSLDPHGYTPLHLAAQNGRIAVVRYLLEAGASPDGILKEAGGCGATPLHRAAFSGQLSCVRALLSAGALPQATDASFLDMKTPLHKAAAQGHADVCLALLEAGADPDARDAAGISALDVLALASPDSEERLPTELETELGDRDAGRSGANSGKANRYSGPGRGSKMHTMGALLHDERGKGWTATREVLEHHGGHKINSRRNFADMKSGSRATVGNGDDATNCSRAGSENRRGSERLDSQRTVLAAEILPSSFLQANGGRETVVTCSSPGTANNDGARETGPRERDMERDRGEIGSVRTACDPHFASSPKESNRDVFDPSRRRCGQSDEHPHVSASKSPVVSARVDAALGTGIDGERGDNACIPCGECRLPKVVMVRARCCGGLVCKSCVRDMSVRRRSCRRCREPGNPGERSLMP